MSWESLTLLKELGFTAYQAKAWVALVHAPTDTLSGYEAAKQSGIPRANIYPVLKQLVERGAVRRVETPEGSRYAATPAAELLENMRRKQQRLLASAEAILPRRAATTQDRPVYSLSSAAQALTAARQLITQATRKLSIAVQPPEAALLAGELRDADERGVRITTLCMEACNPECGGCRGDIHCCSACPDDGNRWLLVVADDDATLAAEFRVNGQVSAMRTHQPLVARLATAYVRQSAALAILGGELGDQFNGLISNQARTLLDSLQAENGFPRRAPTTVESSTSNPGTGTTQEASS